MNMDNNFSQFARAGNPWIDEHEQAEMQAQLVPVRGGRKMAVPKTPYCEPRKPTPRTPEQLEAEQLREELQWLKAYRGGSRTVCPLAQGKPRTAWDVFVKAPRDRELPPRVHVPAREPGHAELRALETAKFVADRKTHLLHVIEQLELAKARLAKL